MRNNEPNRNHLQIQYVMVTSIILFLCKSQKKYLINWIYVRNKLFKRHVKEKAGLNEQNSDVTRDNVIVVKHFNNADGSIFLYMLELLLPPQC